jgi:hypothetical protein
VAHAQGSGCPGADIGQTAALQKKQKKPHIRHIEETSAEE